MKRWSLAFGLVLVCAAPLRAEPGHPALRSLIPLTEVYARGADIPGFDVAGVRCAGLMLAQFDWAARNPGVSGPTEAEMARVDLLFEASEQQRLNEGMELGRAHVSIEREARRVWRLYERRFAENATAGHPWAEDVLIAGDQRVCDALPVPG